MRMNYLRKARSGRVLALGRRDQNRARTKRAVEFWNDPTYRMSQGSTQGLGLARSVRVLPQKDGKGLASA